MIDSHTPPKRAVLGELDRVETVSFRVGLSFLSAGVRMHRSRPTLLSLFSTYYPSPSIQLYPSKQSIVSSAKYPIFLSARISSSKPLPSYLTYPSPLIQLYPCKKSIVSAAKYPIFLFARVSSSKPLSSCLTYPTQENNRGLYVL